MPLCKCVLNLAMGNYIHLDLEWLDWIRYDILAIRWLYSIRLLKIMIHVQSCKSAGYIQNPTDGIKLRRQLKITAQLARSQPFPPCSVNDELCRQMETYLSPPSPKVGVMDTFPTSPFEFHRPIDGKVLISCTCTSQYICTRDTIVLLWFDVIAQVAKTLGSILIWYRPDTFESDRGLIDIDPVAFAISVLKVTHWQSYILWLPRETTWRPRVNQ